MKKKFRQFLEYEVVQKIMFAIKFFTTKRIITAASALTYSTILSLVPICAVVFATARGFGYTRYIEDWFRNLLSSQSQAAEFLIAFVNSYLEHTKSGIILGIGLVFMLYTVVMLTRNVEQAFNDIWHVENRSNIMRTFTDYVAVFFLIPIIIILMSGLSVLLATVLSQTGWEELLGPVMQVIIDLVPFLLMWGAFTLLYVMMPNARVKLVSTIVPGFLAALAMTLLQWFYIHAQMFISNYNAIYGSFAALPLFMLWVQLSWTICLFGAELCYTSQNLEDFNFADDAAFMSHRYKVLLSLILLGRICRRFADGARPYNAVELKQDTSIPLSVTRDLLRNLARAGVLTEITQPTPHSESLYQPAMTLERMTVGSVLDRLEAQGVWSLKLDLKAQMDNKDAWQKILDIRHRYIAEMGQLPIKDL